MPSFGQNLPALRKRAIAEINEKIGVVRMSYITVIPGQDMLYKAKQEEAAACIGASESRDPADYPLLAAEVGITAPSLLEVAQVILNLAALWKSVASSLELLRLGSIKAVEDSPDRAGISTALAQFHAVLETL